MTGPAVIQVECLRKNYGALVAVDDVSLAVAEGEILGIVGPNGAGKTTLIECIEGLRRADAGTIRVLGRVVEPDDPELRQRTGIQLQHASFQDRIRVWELLDLHASLYRRPVDWSELLERLGIADKRNAFCAELSGGQRQRLGIALALVNDPDVLFLDELTTGLDPQARRAMWGLVKEVASRKKTILLTTHFMDEAAHLCDRVGVMDHGKLLALDSPQNLVATLGDEMRIRFEVEGSFDPGVLEGIDGVSRVEIDGGAVVIHGRASRLLDVVVRAITAHEVQFRNLRTEQPGLEDVFLALTGRQLRD